MEWLRLNGDGDEVWNADDERNDVDEKHCYLSTSNAAVDGTLTWVLNDNVSKT